MAKISRDFSAGTLHPRENVFLAGNIGALNAEITNVPADGASTVVLDLRGTFNLTLEVSGSIDGTNWVPIPMRPINQAAIKYVALITGAVQGVWVGKCAHYRFVRARCTAYSSGLCFATLMAANGPLDDSLQGMVTTDIGTTVGAAGAATTLTLASPGAGLRHYITYLAINRFAAATLTAGAAPVTVTTTNIPGSLAFSFGAEAAPQGTLDRWREDFAFPIPATAQATAVTIVCPATTGVIWRVTAGYYVAP